MAEEKPAQPSAEPEASKPKSNLMKNLLVFGLPAFFVQLLIVYALTAKFIVPVTVAQALKSAPAHSKADGKHDATEEGEEESSHEDGEVKEEFVFTVRDLIINPAGTNGQRYLLTTIGFNVSSEEGMKELEKKEMALRDMLNSVLTSKEMKDLIDVSKREVLRQEILASTKDIITHGKVKSIYFSKYIVQ
ncbi:MAG: flagellar basal body-associated FliL family protein [Ignavibacteriae bacterium]|nr:flagellar basal body-associated FliL family protein [Ignavibacteriota bacterium]